MQVSVISASRCQVVFIDPPYGCKGCQIPLPARCYWEEQWLSYTQSSTIWKGFLDRQITSPKGPTPHPPCCCRPWTTSTCPGGGRLVPWTETTTCPRLCSGSWSSRSIGHPQWVREQHYTVTRNVCVHYTHIWCLYTMKYATVDKLNPLLL